MEELAVAARADLIDRRGVQVDEDGARNVFATARLCEEGLVGAPSPYILRIGVGPAIGAQAVLEQVATTSLANPGR